LGQESTVELPARDGGELTFACGMQMLKGVAIFTAV
jgi:plastocyanin domain-containing protein